MAEYAFVLVNVEPTKTREVVDRLRAIPGAIVREVLGPYDVIVELEAGTKEDITSILRHKIRPIQGITNTVTCYQF